MIATATSDSYRAPQPLRLSKLLGALTPARFFAEVWERDAILNRGAFTEAIAGLLTLDQFETLAASAPGGPAGWLNIVDKVARPLNTTAGEAARLSAIYRAYQAGSTLLLTELQRRWPPIMYLCRALEQELLEAGAHLGQRIGANAYLTPAAGQGFDLHYDDHCVFVVQLAGTKRWQVHRSVVELPIDRCEATLSAAQVGPPVLAAELTPGDVLYIPRGFPHAARTTDRSSLHLTLSWHTLTWWQLITEALRSRVELRRSLPPTSAAGHARADLEGVLRDCCRMDDLDARIARRTADLVASLAPLPHGRLRAIEGLTGVGRDTRVARAPGVLFAVVREDEQVTMKLPGSTLRLPAVMEEALSFVAATPAFCPKDVPTGRALFDPVELVRTLIKEGLLHAEPTPPSDRMT
jgi:hypothetical protein